MSSPQELQYEQNVLILELNIASTTKNRKIVFQASCRFNNSIVIIRLLPIAIGTLNFQIFGYCFYRCSGLFSLLTIFTIRLYTIPDKFQVYPPLVFIN